MTERSETGVARRHSPLASLDPWAPWEPLRSVMGRFFDDVGPEWPRASAVAISAPAVDITETDDEYRVRAEIPGVDKNDVTVEVEQGLLTIRGEKKNQRDEKSEKGRRLECSYGAFSRSFSLPQDADADEITADFKEGVLNVAIKKSPESKPKQIAVKG